MGRLKFELWKDDWCKKERGLMATFTDGKGHEQVSCYFLDELCEYLAMNSDDVQYREFEENYFTERVFFEDGSVVDCFYNIVTNNGYQNKEYSCIAEWRSKHKIQ